MIVTIYIGQDRLDLFNDETIEVNSSVQNSEDITKNTTDFTKNFTVPASEVNNRIFKHYYDATLDNGFDARTRRAGRIEIDGFIYREGQFSLLGAKVKQNKVQSYQLVFYGNLVSLVDLLRDDELSSLDLSAFNHDYTPTVVQTGLTTGLFGGDIVYPLIAKKRYYYNSLSTDNTNTPEVSNIAFNGGSAINGVLWNDLNASIKLLPIIEAIEAKYNITFTRDFFGLPEFSNIYLWLNNSNSISLTKEIQIDFTSAGNILDLPNTQMNLVDNYYVCGVTSRVDIVITPTAGYTTVPYKIIRRLDGQDWGEQSGIGTKTFKWRTDIDPKEHTFFIVSDTTFEFDTTFNVVTFGFGTKTASFNTQINEIVFNITNQVPKIKIIDFLKGLFNMFKLVVVQGQTDGEIYIDTLVNYYAQGKTYSVTPYVDTSGYEVERGKLLNEILYKYQDPTSLLNVQFKNNTGEAYGDEQLILQGEDGKLLDGTKQDFSVPFEQIVYERLTDVNDLDLTNIMYGAVIDETLSPTNIKPHLHYVERQEVGDKTLSFINDVNVETEIDTFVHVPSHTFGFEDPQYSLVFGREVNEFTFETINNTLYSNYHNDYISSIFNFKRRNFKFEMKLPIWLILKLKLNDVLEIKGNYYRINDFTYNLITGKAKFNLINSFDNVLNV
jgi:hypothetical protein